MSRRLQLKPVYDERTGDPRLDARARRHNKILRGFARNLRMETKHGRRRKRYLTCVEGHRYMLCVAAATEISFERRHGVKPPADFFGREIDRPDMAPVPSSRGLLTR